MLPDSDRARFLRRFTTVSLGGILLVGLINFLVDPYDRFGMNRLGAYLSSAREFKLSHAGRQPHDAILIGNSRMAMIPAGSLRGRQFFNAGFDGASLEEIRLFLEQRLRSGELVVLSLDPFALGTESDHEPSLAFAPLSIHTLGTYLLSLKTLEYSGRTLADHLAGKEPSYGPDGTTASAEWRRRRDIDDPRWLRNELAFQMSYATEFHFNERRLTELRAIERVVRERAGRLVVFFSPIHEDVLPGFETGPGGAEWARAVREVTGLFPQAVDLTRSPYSSRTNFFRTDPVHFFPEVGTRMLNERVLPPDG